jgi:hypothetical protein
MPRAPPHACRPRANLAPLTLISQANRLRRQINARRWQQARLVPSNGNNIVGAPLLLLLRRCWQRMLLLIGKRMASSLMMMW